MNSLTIWDPACLNSYDDKHHLLHPYLAGVAAVRNSTVNFIYPLIT